MSIDDLESKIEAKRIELKSADEAVKKYRALTPLSPTTQTPGHNFIEMKTAYDNYNRINDEYKSLVRQRSDLGH
jgi:hypothetical protein